MIKSLATIAICSAQIYILWILGYAVRYNHGPSFFANPKKARTAVISMAIVGLLEFATTLYDINGPGGHFPLVVRLPVLVFTTILMLKALW